MPKFSSGIGGQSVIPFPLIVKLTVPVGAIGVSKLAAKTAVKVTEVPTDTKLPGETDKLRLAVSGLTV